MDKQTLSNYGWIVISVLVLSVLIALATPFGTYVKTGVENTTYGIFNTEYNAFNTIGVELCKHNSTEIINESNTYTGDTRCITCKRIIDTGFYFYNDVIPEGGIYYSEVGETTLGDYSTATAVYNEGDHFPTIKNGDVFIYGDYEYRYDVSWNANEGKFIISNSDTWEVRVVNNSKTTYGNPLIQINNINIENLRYTFVGCSLLKKSPKIPNTVVDMTAAFQNCKSLSNCGLPIIPSKTTTMILTFQGCDNITSINDLKLPYGVKNLQETFSDCINLIDASECVIPTTVGQMYHAFADCKNMTNAPIIPKTTINLTGAFKNCSSLNTLVVDALDSPYCRDCITGTQITDIQGNCSDQMKKWLLTKREEYTE